MNLIAYTPDHQELPTSPGWNWRGENPNLSLYHCYGSKDYHRGIFEPQPLHYHTYWELYVHMEGDIQYTNTRETVVLKRGDVIVAPPTACTHSKCGRNPRFGGTTCFILNWTRLSRTFCAAI